MEIQKIKETCLYVKDLARTENFYAQVLNFKIIGRAENRHVFFRAGTTVLLCFNPEETKKEKDLPPHFAYGNIHLAFEVKKEDYETWRQTLLAKGIQIIYEKIWGKDYKSFYFKDPDGHLLEIVPEGMWE